jgi:protein AroM
VKQLGFATIGQAPRSDTVPAIVEALGLPVEVVEAGALDGLQDDVIATMKPREGEYSFATRLVDGRQVVLGKAAAEERLAAVLKKMDGQGLDAIVVLCAGTQLPKLERTLLIEPQLLVDGITAALGANVKTLGILLPLAQQVPLFRLHGEAKAHLRVTHASPYVGDRFSEAGRELAGCDLVVMHCMGYSEAMRRKVAAACGAPTLSAPALVAGVLKQFLS